jgi:adenine phosphoribosyltransferase
MDTLDLKKIIRTIPDWPKKGIMFRDITTLLKNPKAFHYVIEKLADRYSFMKIDSVVGIESRGFILGGALAHCLRRGFIPVRKPGKLPHKTDKVEYELEYGSDALEMHLDAIQPGEKVLLIDDLLATGGTCKAAIDLVEKRSGKVIECAFIIELLDLKGREKLKGYSVYSMVQFEEK